MGIRDGSDATPAHFLKCENIHWRKLNLDTARELYRRHAMKHSQVKAFLLDESIKARRGKRMEDVSQGGFVLHGFLNPPNEITGCTSDL